MSLLSDVVNDEGPANFRGGISIIQEGLLIRRVVGVIEWMMALEMEICHFASFRASEVSVCSGANRKGRILSDEDVNGYGVRNSHANSHGSPSYFDGQRIMEVR
mmetsp:Transcript_2954/g.6407  ORF Transcript_2954/g.6407 Transcript_2954/m.6407 type:complete len:104 (+) Transcript_2954:1720-2031(+)